MCVNYSGVWCKMILTNEQSVTRKKQFQHNEKGNKNIKILKRLNELFVRAEATISWTR